MNFRPPQYRTPKSAPWVRLTWNGLTSVPSAAPSANDVAALALIALGGFQCSKCREPLTEADGYVCCHVAHCPFCGEAINPYSHAMETVCPHVLYRNSDDYWWFAQADRYRGQQTEFSKQWRRLLEPTPPAKRLPSQRGSGYPHWTNLQKADAYPAPFPDYLPRIFTPTLRIYSSKRLHPVLMPYLRPEVKTQLRDANGKRHDYYFSASTDWALEQATWFLTTLEAGTQKLRTMPPDAILRAPSAEAGADG